MALDETYRCDGLDCERTTTKAEPASSWRISMYLDSYLNPGNATRDKREKHYCSFACEQNPNNRN